MKNRNKYFKLIPAIFLFVGLPLLLWVLGDFPRKSLLKEFLSLVTILGFCTMLSQFYFTRYNRQFDKGSEFVMALKIHRYFGYFFMGALFLHPLFIVLPRYFEGGVSPGDAFITLITEWDSLGVVLGMIAYGLMVFVFLTSLFRRKFDLKYKIGRTLHGYLSVLFILAASWHVIDIGQHSNVPFLIYILIMTIGGVFYLLQTYFKQLSLQK